MPEPTLRQAGAQLEVRLDHCHWDAITALRAAGEPIYALDVEIASTRLEDDVLAAASTYELDGLILVYATTGYLFGSGRRRLERMRKARRAREEVA